MNLPDEWRPFDPENWPMPELQVGSLVRVKLSPECPCWAHRLHGLSRPPVDGHLGQIDTIEVKPTGEGFWRAHRYWVAFLDPKPEDGDGYCLSAAFCAVELEPYHHWMSERIAEKARDERSKD